jgi:WD40 repeat protein
VLKVADFNLPRGSRCFSADSKTLVVHGKKKVRLLEMPSGQTKLTFPDELLSVFTAAFSPGGKLLAAGGQDPTVTVWDTQTGQEKYRLSGFLSEVRKVHFSPDGKQLFGVSSDRIMRILDLETGQERTITLGGSVAGLQTGCRAVDFSGDGKVVATASADHLLTVFETETGRLRFKLRAYAGITNGLTSVRISPDGKTVGTVGYDRTLRLWDVETGQAKGAFLGHDSVIQDACFSPDGLTVATGSNRSLRVWDLQATQEHFTFKKHTAFVDSVCFSPDGQSILSVSRPPLLWDWRTGLEKARLIDNRFPIDLGAFNRDGTLIVTGGAGNVDLWDARTGMPKGTLGSQKAQVLGLIPHPDDRTLISYSRDGVVKRWDLVAGKELPAGRALPPAPCAALSPDGKTLALGNDLTVRLHDYQTGEEKLVLTGLTEPARTLCFSPDGKTVVCGSGTRPIGGTGAAPNPGELKAWDTQTGQLRATLKGHLEAVTCVCFSPDGKRLVSASFDQTLRLWDAQTYQEVLTLQGHTGEVAAVCFSPDGETIASCGGDRTVKIWTAKLNP